ncbi:MAG: 16S rRNA (adenine(1518)-N(6)/adenine(1519)-N(6))-dimethyltransferase RsmA [Rickettsiales bacterium]|nr:16S rRNA (adenine(1518)-N(6)/adenine(1519)-N(6))-dimethyltransferase RsmA [Rickettsiales bacterium]
MSKQFYDQITKYNIAPKKNLGQNFLTDHNIINKIVSTVKNIENRHILEIGPGVASLSRAILAYKPYKFSCIEYDERCVNFLKEQLLPQFPNMQIYYADALSFNVESLLTDNKKITIVANLPYNIASVLLINWLEQIHLFDELILMFQKEVAERICASVNTKKYGILSVLAQYLCDCNIAFNISPKCFFPAPKVESSIVVLRPKNDVSTRIQTFLQLKIFVKILFNMRRKTVFNNLKKITQDPATILEKSGIDQNLRPENLSIENFITLINTLKNYERQ